jgi:hypothetical protein
LDDSETDSRRMTSTSEAEAQARSSMEAVNWDGAQEEEQVIKIEVPTTTQKRQIRAATGPKVAEADDCKPRSSVSEGGIASDDARPVEGISVGHGDEMRCREVKSRKTRHNVEGKSEDWLRRAKSR